MRAAKAFGPQTGVDWSPENWQMAEVTRLIVTVTICDSLATAATSGTLYEALNRQKQVAGLRYLGFDNANIRDVKRNGDERMLRHKNQPFFVDTALVSSCHTSTLEATTTSRAFHGYS